MTKIYLYSDEPVLAQGLGVVVADSGQFQLECFFCSLPELVSRVGNTPIEVLLLDLTPAAPFSILADIRKAAPATKLVVWVNSISAELAFQAIGSGVRGILRKSLSADLQVECLRKVHAGDLWFEKSLTDCFMGARRVALSEREGQLVSLISYCGLRNKEIADTLGITEGTVKIYLSKLFRKLGVKDRLELALFGLKNLPAGQGEEKLGLGRLQLPTLRSVLLDGTGHRPSGTP